MRTFTASIIILSSEIVDTKINGMAIDGDIAIKFAVANTEVNQRLFIPEAQLVVSGKFRIAQEIASIGAWIDRIVAVISIPAPELQIVAPATEVAIEPEIIVSTPLTPAQKSAATRAAKKAKTAKLTPVG
jgi:hypothetical protein